MSLRFIPKLLASLSIFACASAFATPITVGTEGVQSYGVLGDTNNTVFSLNVGANAVITGISYNVNLTASDPSYLSEISLQVSDSAITTGAIFSPSTTQAPGTENDTGIVNLASSFAVGSDGILRFEFFEQFDDASVAPDGYWNFGTITFEVVQAALPPAGVPEPDSILLVGAGLAMMGYAARRRRNGAMAAAPMSL